MKNSGKRQILRICLSVLVLAGLLLHFVPLGVMAKAADSSLSIDDIFKNESAPDDYKLDVNPYGYQQGEAFTLAAQNELFLLQSTGSTKSYSWYGDFSAGMLLEGLTLSSAELSEIDGEDSPFGESGTYKSTHAELFTKAVAFDPTGSGRKDHIGFLALRPDGSYNGKEGAQLIVYVYNTNTGKYSVAYHAGWAEQMTTLEKYLANNYFDITAGKYTEGVGETLVCYLPLDTAIDGSEGVILREWKVASTDDSIKLKQIGETKAYLNPAYFAEPTFSGPLNHAIQNKLSGSLVTGDFNGDRIDDLAVLSWLDAPSGAGYASFDQKIYTPYLVIIQGGGSDSILSKTSNVMGQYIEGETQYNEKTFDAIPGAASIAAGDVDGDGYDEVVVGGWTKILKKYDNEIRQRVIDGITVGVYGYTEKYGAQQEIELKHYTSDTGASGGEPVINKWSLSVIFAWMVNNSALPDDFVYDLPMGDIYIAVQLPQFAVETVSINGDNSAAEIFLNGTFAKFDPVTGVTHSFTPTYFNGEAKFSNSDLAGVTSQSAVAYIDSMAVGVFDGNTVGREQITVSVANIMGGSWPDFKGYYKGGTYLYMLGVMGGHGYDDKTNDSDEIISYGTNKYYYSTGFTSDYTKVSDHPVMGKGNKSNSLNCLVVAIDRGLDGTVARYKSKGYYYTRPNPVAVLQAAPYFGELGDYATLNMTTYSITTTYTIGNQTAESTSYSVGFSTEIQVPGLKISLGTGYTEGWSKSFEESFEETYTESFSASYQNEVILSLTPLIVYDYEIQNPDGTWDEDRIVQITVPSAPIYASLSVQEYNRFAETYSEHFNQIDALFLTENEGVPANYMKDWASVQNGTQISRSSVEVSGNTDGYVTVSQAEGTVNTFSFTNTSGYYIDGFVGVGCSLDAVSVYAGFDMHYASETERGSYTSEGGGIGISGAVQDHGGANAPEEVEKQYRFTWALGYWSMNLSKEQDNGPIPAIGYVVTNVSTAPKAPAKPTAEEVEGEADKVRLTWDAMEGAVGYHLYLIDENGEYNKVNSEVITENSYVYTINTKAPFLRFAVTALDANGESVYSPAEIYYPQSAGAAGLSAYEVAVKNGYVGTEAQWLDSLIGADGAAGKDGVGIEEISINPVNGEMTVLLSNSTMIYLGRVVGADGEDGVGIHSIDIDDNGDLIVIMTDGTERNMGSTKGEQGNGIESIIKTSTSGLVDTYTITFTGGGTSTFTVTNGERGARGPQGIQGIRGEKGEDGHTPVITIQNGFWYIDGVSSGQSALGLQGDTGNGISHIAKTATNGLEDVYTITFTDGRETFFAVTNGKDGKDGKDGEKGTDGQNGADGVTPHIGENGNWWLGETDTGVRAAVAETEQTELFWIITLLVILGLLAISGNVAWIVYFVDKKKRA